MHRRSLLATSVAVAAALMLAGCGGDESDTDGATGDTGTEAGSEGGGGSVGVILPDSATSPRWEANDRPLLQAAFEAAGIECGHPERRRRHLEVRHAL